MTIRKVKTGWVLDSGRIFGQRIRRIYKTEAEAVAAKSHAKKLGMEIGQRAMMVWLDIELDEIVEIIRYRQAILAIQEKPDWAKGQELHLRYAKSVASGAILLVLIGEYVARKRKAGLADEYVDRLERDLNKFAVRYPKLTVPDVDYTHIDEFLDELSLTGITRKNRIRDIRGLFGFAIKKGLCETNPADLTVPTKIVKKRIKTFTLQEIAVILWVADNHPNWELIPYLCLGLWGSARACEAYRLFWENLQQPDNCLVLEAAATKVNQERVTEDLPAVLMDWIRPYAKRVGPMAPPETTVEWRRARYLVPAVRKLLPAFKWVHNGLRKSSISAEYAASKDAKSVATRHGTSPEMLFRNYRAVMLKSQGEQYARMTRAGIIPYLRGIVPEAELTAWIKKWGIQLDGTRIDPT